MVNMKNYKKFEFAMICGRFQDFHIGHYYVVDTALKIAENVLIFVGSSQESRT